MNKLVGLLAEALFPERFTCDICGIETFGENLCPDCRKTITFNDGATCTVCGRKSAVSAVCLECKAKAPKFKRAVSPLIYGGGANALIAKFKNGEGYLKNYFADLIVKKLVDFPELDCLVYVPMTERAERRRGYNQAKLLAKSVSEKIGVPVIDALIKIKDTNEQKSLSRKQRTENLKRCFKVATPDEIKGKSVLLIDDILTTGATADAICERLLTAGAKKIYFATAASVEYKPQK